MIERKFICNVCGIMQHVCDLISFPYRKPLIRLTVFREKVCAHVCSVEFRLDMKAKWASKLRVSVVHTSFIALKSASRIANASRRSKPAHELPKIWHSSRWF